MILRTCYEVLGVPFGAAAATIRNSYLAIARKLHPDTGPESDAEEFKCVALAYAVLKDEERRHKYDELLRLQKLICTDCKGAGYRESAVSFTQVRREACRSCKGTGLVKNKA